MSTTVRTSLHGKKLGLSPENNLVSEGIQISQPCVNATITVGDEAANVRAITIQLSDSKGNDIDYAETVEIIMYLDAAKVAFVATGGSTGIEIGTDGALLDVVAKKYFLATSETDGDIDLTWTDTGTEVAFLGVRLPNGRIVMSTTLANAA